jgi:orotidine-5'-phosphate decarboxylase
MALPARDRLIVALDFPAVAAAEAMVARLGTAVSFYKVGLQLLFARDGVALAERLIKGGKRVFVDGKFLDIDNTVGGAIASVVTLGATFTTVHAYPQTMRAAVAARGKSALKLLAVTVLTSMDDGDAAEAGYALPVRDLVLRRAEQARAAGIDGVVASPAETAAIRTRVGQALTIVTPGIRPAGSASADQKRLATPAAAVAAGADYLVAGRPITEAGDPIAAANTIVAEIERATVATTEQR